jgi:hypothetical protein
MQLLVELLNSHSVLLFNSQKITFKILNQLFLSL